MKHLIYIIPLLALIMSCESLPSEEEMASRAAKQAGNQTGITVSIDTAWNGIIKTGARIPMTNKSDTDDSEK